MCNSRAIYFIVTLVSVRSRRAMLTLRQSPLACASKSASAQRNRSNSPCNTRRMSASWLSFTCPCACCQQFLPEGSTAQTPVAANRFPTVATVHHVVNRTGVFDAQGTGHGDAFTPVRILCQSCGLTPFLRTDPFSSNPPWRSPWSWSWPPKLRSTNSIIFGGAASRASPAALDPAPAPIHFSLAAPPVRGDGRKHGEWTSPQSRLPVAGRVGILTPLPGPGRHPPKPKCVNRVSDNMASQFNNAHNANLVRNSYVATINKTNMKQNKR